MTRRWVLMFLTLICGGQQALAGGYGYNPLPKKPIGPYVVYFGSARDGWLNYIPDVTIVMETEHANFVAVTDERGRFRWEIPAGFELGRVTFRCSRNGYATVSISDRKLGNKADSPVEVSCILKK